jgi:glycosyltransferase involved in cell wall biosynthesis
MKTPHPKISILMPSYNQGPFLEAAIRSVLTQDYPHKELILVDGGSTDDSMEIIRRYQADLAYWISEPDRGQTHALNKALPHATGQIIGWLNSDDCYLPGAFRRVAQAFQRNPEAVLVHGERIMIDGDGHVSGWTVLPAFDPATTGYVICSETAFWRKRIAETSPFNESLRFAMDVDFFCRLYHQGRFVKLNSYLGAFRCHAANKSSTILDVGHTEGQALWKSIFPDLPEAWRNHAEPSTLRKILPLFQHPLTITFPYLYRRYLLGLRGMETRKP